MMNVYGADTTGNRFKGHNWFVCEITWKMHVILFLICYVGNITNDLGNYELTIINIWKADRFASLLKSVMEQWTSSIISELTKEYHFPDTLYHSYEVIKYVKPHNLNTDNI